MPSPVLLPSQTPPIPVLPLAKKPAQGVQYRFKETFLLKEPGTHSGAIVEENVAASSLELSVVIPAYNESKRIERTLAGATDYLNALGSPYEILVVDDGSPDDTAGVVAAWANERHAQTYVRVLRYHTNRGKGYAVRHGVLRAAGARILFMDADLATPIEELAKLQAAIATTKPGETVYAIGSRDIRGVDLLVRQPWYREKLGRVFNGLVQLLATPGIVDTQCGFKLLSRDAGRAIFSRCILDGFSFDVEAIFIAKRLGFRVTEVPVRWAHQEGAAAFTSKAKYLLHGLKMIGELLRIRWAHRGLHPQKSPILNPFPAPPLP